MRVVKAIDRFLFAPADAKPLALFRIFLGLLIVINYVAHIPHWVDFFGRSGFIDPDPGRWAFLLRIPGVPDISYAWLGVAASLLFIIGYRTWTMTLILFLLLSARNHTNLSAVNGEDLVTRFLLFFSLFMRLDERWSIHSLRPARWNFLSASVWPVRLIQLITISIYIFSLPRKIGNDVAWLNGDFMYYVLINSTWSRFPFPELAYNWSFSATLTYSALLLEATFPILVWSRARLPIVLLAAFFHLSIAVILSSVSFFSLSMVAAFILFLRDSDFEWLHNRLCRFAKNVSD